MWPAIVLLWLSLFWTLLCLLFYRDRSVILEASLPAWIVALLVWLVLWSPLSVFRVGRWWSGKHVAAPKKKPSSRQATRARRSQPPGGGARPGTRTRGSRQKT